MHVEAELRRFVDDEVLPSTGISPERFWTGLGDLVVEFGARNRDLLARRAQLQAAVDTFLAGTSEDDGEAFLRRIGYLVDEPPAFTIMTDQVDREIGQVAGPQLVVPVSNARFAANAVNARWGSLYDALYGTDAIVDAGPFARGDGYNETRGAEVVTRVRAMLDSTVPLLGASHADAVGYAVDPDGLRATVGAAVHRLEDPRALVGYQGPPEQPSAVVLRHHGLHVLLRIDPQTAIGAADRAGIADVQIESAITTIMDLEDSVAAVDAEDKVAAYRTWLRLMQRRLQVEVHKAGRTFTRAMNRDIEVTAADGTPVVLPGRSLMLIRHVGLLMTTDAVRVDGDQIPEGILDALVASACAVHDLRGSTAGSNSKAGSIYAVKPKLHGPDEVSFTCDLFERVEQILDLPRLTIKVGIMDEERRTSANLRACVHVARERIAFINTGFLDRTGDEIHTTMRAGAVVPKAGMQRETWLEAYEDRNVDVGLACGFPGRAQIGKGMWAAPDNMAEMLATKGAQPRAGASCAWVPSPTAATLHALHYHEVDVAHRQSQLAARAPRPLSDLLTPPLARDIETLDRDRRMAEVDNNVQGILGYTVRWVDQGVGCSKVPDLAGTPLMEDRATCRISSQHLANWLAHGVVSPDDVERALRRMAAIVDEQNASDPAYEPMAPAFDGLAFLAARQLALDGASQPSGYTEPILHAARRARKRTLTGKRS